MTSTVQTAQGAPMDTVIVYLDDAATASTLLEPMFQTKRPMLWVLVACAPRITRRISRWLSNRSREQWRTKWAERLYHDLAVLRAKMTGRVHWEVATGPLPVLTMQIQMHHPRAQVVDARKPKMASDSQSEQ